MEKMGTREYFCEHAFLPRGWTAGVVLEVDDAGDIVAVAQRVDAGSATRIGRFVVPGMPNLHSHAFQRVMAGHAEHMTDPHDTFWSWRETMYRVAAGMSPDDLEAIAAQLQVEMLKSGFTAVCEFHYLHHGPDAKPYAPPSAMSDALCRAAESSGIGMTLLPTLYMSGGFDGRALSARQLRFLHEPEQYLRLVEDLQERETGQLAVGVALHSLRAVPVPAMRAVLESVAALRGPVHIHIAEQQAEVDDCLKTRGKRPVAWLLDNADVDLRWCLVHATHVTQGELHGIAQSGAIAGLCPTTEANLGDGLFPLRSYIEAGGAYGIGSDSNVSVSPVEELRWLEYGQRLAAQRRNVVALPGAPSTGENLWRGALVGGAQACGRRVGTLAPGNRADLLVLDHDAAELLACDPQRLFDVFVFAGNRNLVRDVMVGGRWVVRDGRHAAEDAIAARYRDVASPLVASWTDTTPPGHVGA